MSLFDAFDEQVFHVALDTDLGHLLEVGAATLLALLIHRRLQVTDGRVIVRLEQLHVLDNLALDLITLHF